MIEQLRSDILHDVTNLLYTQNKDNTKRSFGLSFDELFRISRSDIADNYHFDNEFDNIEIEMIYEEPMEQAENGELANENSRINELNKGIMDQGNEHNVENIIDKKDITKGLNRKAKGITKDIANNKIETNDNDKIIKDVQKVKLDYKSLDFNTKEKVKAIIRDLKSGKINEMTANAFIARILKNVGVKNTKLLNKKKLSRVKINEKKNNSELKLESKKKRCRYR